MNAVYSVSITEYIATNEKSQGACTIVNSEQQVRRCHKHKLEYSYIHLLLNK